MFLRSGCWIPAALLLPNAIYLVLPSKSTNLPALRPAAKWLESVEWTLRFFIFFIPCLYSLGFEQIAAHRFLFVVMMAALFFYFCGWLRYVRQRSFQVLFRPLAGVPYPMAVSPVLYLLLASALVHSAALAVFTLLFGIAHVAVSRHSALQLMEGQPRENK
jgi:phosphatidylserine synthase